MSVEHHVVELATLATDPHARICPYKGVVSAARISCIVAHNIFCGICYQLHVERVVQSVKKIRNPPLGLGIHAVCGYSIETNVFMIYEHGIC